jgi:CO/xanthine dehydrogenase FAD-binding subunit
MTNNYYRPQSLKEATLLLNEPNTIPLAGGTYINTKFRGQFNVVDLQNLGMDKIVVQNNKFEVGATTKLQQLLLNEQIPIYFKNAIKLEAPLNIRNSASLGGLLFTCDGCSPIATSLLALNATIILEPKREEIPISNFFTIRSNFPKGHLIASVTFPVNMKFCFTHVARTPFDRPFVCTALAKWDGGRTRLAIGGFGAQPLLVIDGQISDDISSAACSAFSNAEDEWASADYRSDIAGILSRRCLDIIDSGT